MRLLGLDTATEACSAALLVGDRLVQRAMEMDRGHADRILPMIDELLRECGLALRDLDAIAFGRGPGGFTGVRLAASVTQGLAFGADLPVIPVSDLSAVAQRVMMLDPSATCVLVCNDARMQEVYWAPYERGPDGIAVLQGEERVGKPDAVTLPASWGGRIQAAGRGFAAYPPLRQRLAARLGSLHDSLLPRASEIVMLAAPVLRAGGARPPEEALPVYVRDDVAQPRGG